LFSTVVEKRKKGWTWCAKGFCVGTFIGAYYPLKPNDDGWLRVGWFKTEKAAQQDLAAFRNAYFRFLDHKFGMVLKPTGID